MEIEGYDVAAVEVLDILDNTNQTDIKKIPQSFIKFLVDIASPNYKVSLDHSKSLTELNLKEKTKELLGIIYINWWCNEEEKKQYKEIIKEIETEQEELRRQKYNPENIFENTSKVYNNTKVENSVDNKKMSLIEYKEENIFKRIFNKIIKLLKK